MFHFPGTAVVLWGIVPSSSVADACHQIVNTGTHTIPVEITGSNNGGWGAGTIHTNLQVIGAAALFFSKRVVNCPPNLAVPALKLFAEPLSRLYRPFHRSP